MRVMGFILLLLVAPVVATMADAQRMTERHLPLDGQIAADGMSVVLDWFDTDRPRIGSVIVKRRQLGQTGGQSWQTIATPKAGAMRYNDTTTRPGIAYEYQVLRTEREIIDVGYWTTGVALPLRAVSGTAYLVVDKTVAADLAPWVDRLGRDLSGDGWRVYRTDAPRGRSNDPHADLQSIAEIKKWLQDRYREAPAGPQAVILLGHLPILKSGRANPDGHEVEPQPTDLIYGDIDGVWRIGPEGTALENTVPGDNIELQVGRIDFAPVSAGERTRELHLLRAYLDKAHHWRMGLHGDLRAAYGTTHHLTAEIHGLRNIVGPDAVTTGGHHDVGERQPWLWGVDFGDWKTGDYAEKYRNKAVFTINFGSGKHRFDRSFNGMTALLAQPFYPLTVGWGARPAWRLHPMALGETIGEVHLRIVNNGRADLPYQETMDYFPTGEYLWRNPVWVTLLGDPTLHAFVLGPPGTASAVATDNGIALDWVPSADPATTGYRVYRADRPNEPFVLISGAEPLDSTTFQDPAPRETSIYMIRAEGLKTVYAGSFRTLSQGVFTAAGQQPLTAPDIALSTAAGVPVALPDMFSQARNDRIHAVVAPPETGDLDFDGTDWLYTPPPGQGGDVVLRYSVSDLWQTAVGHLTITVDD